MKDGEITSSHLQPSAKRQIQPTDEAGHVGYCTDKLSDTTGLKCEFLQAKFLVAVVVLLARDG